MAYIIRRSKIWQIEFRYNKEPKRYSLKTKNRARAEYLKKIIEDHLNIGELPNIDEIIYEKNPKKNVYEFIEMIKNEILNNLSVSKNWRKRQLVYVEHFIKFLNLEKIKYFMQIKISTIEKYRNWRLNTYSEKTKESISSKTVKDEIMFLKNMIFDRALEDKIISDNPARRTVKSIKVYNKERPPFTEEEVEKLFFNAPNNFHRDFYMVLYYTGSRFGEVAHLEWQHINFNSNYIDIKNTSSHQTKTRKDRKVPIHPKLKIVLAERSKEKGCKYVFPSTIKKNQPVVSISRGFNRVKSDLCIETVKTLHSFRHSFGSHLQSRGVPIEVVQEMMGHADIRMTRHYQKIEFSVLEKAIKKL